MLSGDSRSPLTTIFICYRRDDTQGHAGRLYDRLRQEFGRKHVFIDMDALQPGDDFVHAIQEKLEKCQLMLAVIGRRWLTAMDEGGRPRLEDEGDYVRVEIETALQRNLRTIPVLVDRASMPRKQDLPESLSALARRQAIELSDARWEYDIGTLISSIKRLASSVQEDTQTSNENTSQPRGNSQPERQKAKAQQEAPKPQRQKATPQAIRADWFHGNWRMELLDPTTMYMNYEFKLLEKGRVVGTLQGKPAEEGLRLALAQTGVPPPIPFYGDWQYHTEVATLIIVLQAAYIPALGKSTTLTETMRFQFTGKEHQTIRGQDTEGRAYELKRLS